MRVLVLYAHPNPESFGAALHATVVEAVTAAGHEVDDCDLYAEGFDPVLVVNEERRRRDLDKVEETRAHRELVAWCDAMVFVYPVWWGGFPALLKGWLDRVWVPFVTFELPSAPAA